MTPACNYLPYLPEEKNKMEDRGCAGLVLLDVDDFIPGGGVRHQAKMEELRERFHFGKWRDLYLSHGEYLGRTVRQLANFEIRVGMKRYIMEKLRPVVLPRDRACDEQALLTETEVSLLRGMGGFPLVDWQRSTARCWGSLLNVDELGQGGTPHSSYQTGQQDP